MEDRRKISRGLEIHPDRDPDFSDPDFSDPDLGDELKESDN
jgi:hypothetical protein